ncbi:MAG: hypothetical protein KIT84_12735 [Labilithrix sp.]|nr:hypothetical protein [Labilithrix sp.]MCW5811881.1 hypothetical protein [Labilithrix sp.]
MKRDSDRPTALNSADPIKNFTLTTDERIRALTIGVPSWAARKRKIEDDEARHVKELVELYDTLVAKKKTLQQIELGLISAATALDLDKLNALVDKHNKYYPIEANLPMERATGAYLVYGKRWEPEPLYTPARLVGLARSAILARARRG